MGRCGLHEAQLCGYLTRILTTSLHPHVHHNSIVPKCPYSQCRLETVEQCALLADLELLFMYLAVDKMTGTVCIWVLSVYGWILGSPQYWNWFAITADNIYCNNKGIIHTLNHFFGFFILQVSQSKRLSFVVCVAVHARLPHTW